MSAPRRLTTKLLRTLATPAGKERWVSDDNGLHGTGRLVVRAQAGGQLRFYYRHPRTGAEDSRTEPLGLYSFIKREGHLTLSEARAIVDRRHAQLQGANRSVAASMTPAAVEAPSSGPTLSELCEAYVQSLKTAGKSSAKQVRAVFKRCVDTAAAGRLPAASLTTKALVNLLRDVISQTTNHNGMKLRGYLHSAYNHGIASQVDPAKTQLKDLNLTMNPVAAIPSMREFTRPGNRALSLKELTAFWRRLNGPGPECQTIAARAVRVATLLGGQRGEQLLRLKRMDINFEDRTAQLFDPKGARRHPREHLLPLNALAQNEIQQLLALRASSNSDFLFSTSGAKTRQEALSRVVASISHQMIGAGECSAPFAFTDLRRTCETRMSALGIPQEYREQIQSHNLGNITMRHYNRHDYLVEKRAALATWEEFLSSLLT